MKIKVKHRTITSKKHAHAHLRYLRFRPGDDLYLRHPPNRAFFNWDDARVPYYLVHERVDAQDDNDFCLHTVVFGFNSAPEISSGEITFTMLCMIDSFYQQTDVRLDWYAVTHAHKRWLPHVHMVIMPTDLDGKQVRISKSELALLQKIANYYCSADRITGMSYSEWLNEDNRGVD